MPRRLAETAALHIGAQEALVYIDQGHFSGGINYPMWRNWAP